MVEWTVKRTTPFITDPSEGWFVASDSKKLSSDFANVGFDNEWNEGLLSREEADFVAAALNEYARTHPVPVFPVRRLE